MNKDKPARPPDDTEFKEIIGYFNNHLRQCAKSLDKDLKIYIPTDLDGTKAQRDGSKELFEQTIRTSHNVLEQLFKRNHIALIGLTQSDKSASQFLSGILYPVIHYLKTNQFCFTLFTCPHSNGKYEGQLKEKFSKISPIIKEIVVEYKNKKISILDYQNELQKIHYKCKTEGSKELLNLAGNGGYYPIRLSKKMKDKFSSFCRELINDLKVSLLIVRDEIHLNAKEGSVQDKTFEEDNEVFESCYDLFNKKQMLLLAVSATPWNALHFAPIKIEFDENYYCGFPQKYISNDEEIFLEPKIIPTYVSFEEIDPFFAKYEGVNWPACFAEEETFQKEIGGNWKTFKKSCAQALYRIIVKNYDSKRETLDGKLINGSLVRFVNKNTESTELIELIKEINTDKNMSFYSMYDDKTRSVDKFIEEKGIDKDNSKRKYVIFVTASGRSSDTFPRTLGYCIDCTNEATSWAALFQGIIGRATGYFKNPFIILSSKNKKLLDRHKENGWHCEAFMPGGKHKPLIDGMKHTKQKIYHTFYFNDLKQMFSVADATKLKSFCKAIDNRNKNYKGFFGKKCNIDVRQHFTMESLNEILKLSDPYLKLVDFQNEKYLLDDKGNPCLAKRTTNQGGTKGNVNGNNIIIRFRDPDGEIRNFENQKPHAIDLLVESEPNKQTNDNGHLTGKINNG